MLLRSKLAVFITATSLVFSSLVPAIAEASSQAILQRQSIDPTIAQKSPLVKCLNAIQLDCVEKVTVQHRNGTIEEAKFIETRLVDFPDENNQKVQYGDILFDFHSNESSGPLKRLRLSTFVMSPVSTFNGKKAGAYWVFLQREMLPNEPPQQAKGVPCSISTPLQCMSYPALDTDDIFHVYLRTSWLSPVSASGEGKDFNIDYRKITNGYQWKVSGAEFFQPVFSEPGKLGVSLKPGNENLIPDRLNPTLYFALDHGGKDLSDSYWDPSCMAKGFTRTMWNAPFAGQLYWDLANNSLNFNMYAPHLDTFGRPYQGVFRTKFQKAWLDCRFPENNLSTATEITVQVVNESGIPQVATTSVSMKDGIIDISASGFHFSSPRIVAKKSINSGVTNKSILDLKDDWSENLLTTSAKQTPQKVTITCTKGNLIKKISSIKPLCPLGYKKK